MAEDWANALICLSMSADDTTEVFLARVMQAQNTIAILEQVADLPRSIIERLEEEESDVT